MLTRFVPTSGARLAPRHLAPVVALAVVSLAAASLIVAALEGQLGIPDASAVFIVAVVAMATVFGTTPAALTAIAAFVVYDFLFTRPVLTLMVSDPVEWVNLVLFLLIAVVVGRLAALQQERAAEADRRAREAQALFAISRTLATAPNVVGAAPAVLQRLAADSRMARIWFGVAAGTGESTILDSRPDEPRPHPTSYWTLIRSPGDRPAQWIRTHIGDGSPKPGRAAAPPGESLFRVKIEADGATLGSLWATRPPNAAAPGREETRLLALAADQLGLAVHRDDLAATATAAEVVRQSDALKSALLTSVSHDLRTPLASIRAAAGSLMDPAVPWTEAGARETARAIDVEADRLNRLVRNLLDLSRIEAGALRPDLEVLDLEDVFSPLIARVAPLFGSRAVEIAVDASVPPVLADAVYLDEAVTNLLENAARYAGDGARVRVSAMAGAPATADDRAAASPASGTVRILVEDSGPGVPAERLPRLFEKFQRRSRPGDRTHDGMGIGLSVVKGLVEAMHGSVRAARSAALGGLSIEVTLPAVDVPADPPR